MGTERPAASNAKVRSLTPATVRSTIEVAADLPFSSQFCRTLEVSFDNARPLSYGSGLHVGHGLSGRVRPDGLRTGDGKDRSQARPGGQIQPATIETGIDSRHALQNPRAGSRFSSRTGHRISSPCRPMAKAVAPSWSKSQPPCMTLPDLKITFQSIRLGRKGGTQYPYFCYLAAAFRPAQAVHGSRVAPSRRRGGKRSPNTPAEAQARLPRSTENKPSWPTEEQAPDR